MKHKTANSQMAQKKCMYFVVVAKWCMGCAHGAELGALPGVTLRSAGEELRTIGKHVFNGDTSRCDLLCLDENVAADLV